MTVKSNLYGWVNRQWVPVVVDTNGVLGISLRDADGNSLTVDEVTNSLVTIDVVHHEIHEGDLYSVSYKSPDANPIADNGTIAFTIQMTTETGHLVATGAGGGDAELALYETPTLSGAGTSATPVNHNRNSTNTSLATIERNPTLSSNGTLLEVVFLPGGTGGNAIGEVGQQRNEWILKPGTKYLVIITNRAGNAQPMYLSLFWYEELM